MYNGKCITSQLIELDQGRSGSTEIMEKISPISDHNSDEGLCPSASGSKRRQLNLSDEMNTGRPSPSAILKVSYMSLVCKGILNKVDPCLILVMIMSQVCNANEQVS